jgi:hypothetical protein
MTHSSPLRRISTTLCTIPCRQAQTYTPVCSNIVEVSSLWVLAAVQLSVHEMIAGDASEDSGGRGGATAVVFRWPRTSFLKRSTALGGMRYRLSNTRSSAWPELSMRLSDELPSAACNRAGTRGGSSSNYEEMRIECAGQC